MALVSGQSFSLNSNAPAFLPRPTTHRGEVVCGEISTLNLDAPVFVPSPIVDGKEVVSGQSYPLNSNAPSFLPRTSSDCELEADSVYYPGPIPSSEVMLSSFIPRLDNELVDAPVPTSNSEVVYNELVADTVLIPDPTHSREGVVSRQTSILNSEAPSFIPRFDNKLVDAPVFLPGPTSNREAAVCSELVTAPVFIPGPAPSSEVVVSRQTSPLNSEAPSFIPTFDNKLVDAPVFLPGTTSNNKVVSAPVLIPGPTPSSERVVSRQKSVLNSKATSFIPRPFFDSELEEAPVFIPGPTSNNEAGMSSQISILNSDASVFIQRPSPERELVDASIFIPGPISNKEMVVSRQRSSLNSDAPVFVPSTSSDIEAVVSSQRCTLNSDAPAFLPSPLLDVEGILSRQRSTLSRDAPVFIPSPTANNEVLVCGQRSTVKDAPAFPLNRLDSFFGSFDSNDAVLLGPLESFCGSVSSCKDFDDEFMSVIEHLEGTPQDDNESDSPLSSNASTSPDQCTNFLVTSHCEHMTNSTSAGVGRTSADKNASSQDIPFADRTSAQRHVERNFVRTNLFGNRKAEVRKLQFHQPQKNESSPIAWIPKNVSTIGAQRWNLCLVGQVWGGEPKFKTVCNTVNRLWGRDGRIEVSEGEHGFYFFRFPNERSMSWVLEGGPWHICNYALTLKKWEPNFQLMDCDDSHIPLWITLRGVPVELMTQEGLSRIASVIGNPLYMDIATANHSRVSYAKVCIEVELNKEIPKSIIVQVEDGNSMVIDVSCFWEPVRCLNCQVFGHKGDECPQRKEKEEADGCGRKGHGSEHAGHSAMNFSQHWIPKPRSLRKMNSKPLYEDEIETGEEILFKPLSGQPSGGDKGKGVKVDYGSFEQQLKGESSKGKEKFETHDDIASTLELLYSEENETPIHSADLYMLNRLGLSIQKNIDWVLHESDKESVSSWPSASSWPFTSGQLLQV